MSIVMMRLLFFCSWRMQNVKLYVVIMKQGENFSYFRQFFSYLWPLCVSGLQLDSSSTTDGRPLCGPWAEAGHGRSHSKELPWDPGQRVVWEGELSREPSWPGAGDLRKGVASPWLLCLTALKRDQKNYMQSRGMARDSWSHSTSTVKNRNYFYVKKQHYGFYLLLNVRYGRAFVNVCSCFLPFCFV